MAPREIVAGGDISGGREQRVRLANHGPNPGDTNVRNAVAVASAAGCTEDLREGKAVGAAQPIRAGWRNTLTIPGSIDAGFIHQHRCNHPGVRDLIVVSGTLAVLYAT